MNTLDRTNSTAVAALDFNPTDARLRYANDDVSQTLTARARTGGNQVPLVQVQPLVFNPNAGITEKGGGFALSEDVTPTLKTDHNPAVAFASNQRDEVRELEVAGALAAQPGIKQQTYILPGRWSGECDDQRGYGSHLDFSCEEGSAAHLSC